LFIPDEQLRKTFEEAMFALALNKTNLFAIVATKAAYSCGEPQSQESGAGLSALHQAELGWDHGLPALS